MKHFNLILLLVCFTSVADLCSAQRPEGRPRFGQGPQNRGIDAQPDPAQLVARFIREFDKDSDSKLDASELIELFTTLRERRAAMEQGRRPPRGGGFPRKPNGNEPRRKPLAEEAVQPGGDAPKRPPSE